MNYGFGRQTILVCLHKISEVRWSEKPPLVLIGSNRTVAVATITSSALRRCDAMVAVNQYDWVGVVQLGAMKAERELPQGQRENMTSFRFGQESTAAWPMSRDKCQKARMVRRW